MNHDISSLMDGELGADEAEGAIRSCCSSREAARTWQEYHLIGDVLRGGMPHPTNTAERVREALETEPAIVARPKRVLDTMLGRVAFAAAASVATIGVVGWIGTQGGQVPAPVPAVATTTPADVQPVASKTTVQPAAPAPDLQEYLAAHRHIPSPDLYRQVHRTAPAAAR